MTPVLCLMVLVVVCNLMTAYGEMKSKRYQLVTDKNGINLCSFDQPYTTIIMEASTLNGQCGVQCTVSSFCQFYQFKANLFQCELFYDTPTNFSAIQQCTAYIIASSSQSTSVFTFLLALNFIVCYNTFNKSANFDFITVIQPSF